MGMGASAAGIGASVDGLSLLPITFSLNLWWSGWAGEDERWWLPSCLDHCLTGSSACNFDMVVQQEMKVVLEREFMLMVSL